MADIIPFNGKSVETPARPRRSTAPMDCINDVACTVSQVKGVLELVITAAEPDIDDKNIINSLYAIQALLESAWDRCGDARDRP